MDGSKSLLYPFIAKEGCLKYKKRTILSDSWDKHMVLLQTETT